MSFRVITVVGALYSVLILFLLTFPPETIFPGLKDFDAYDLAGHFVVFAPWGALASLVLRLPSAGREEGGDGEWGWSPALATLGLASAGGLVFGLFSELLQNVIPGRRPDLLDVFADGGGVVLGALLVVSLPSRLIARWFVRSGRR